MRGEDALDQVTVPFDDDTMEGLDPLFPEEIETVTAASVLSRGPESQDEDAPWFVDLLIKNTVEYYGCSEIPHESYVCHPSFQLRGTAGRTIRIAAEAQAAIAALIARRPDDASLVTAVVEGVGLWTLALTADLSVSAQEALQREMERRQAEEAVQRNHDRIAEARKKLPTADDKREWALAQLPSHPRRTWYGWYTAVARRYGISNNGAQTVLQVIKHQLDPELRPANSNEPDRAA
tara:strand:+ start:2313 stop:3020 length:708 start_codon:yes stop_codon:yes gene_type:complete